jgi:hypothetical protein
MTAAPQAARFNRKRHDQIVDAAAGKAGEIFFAMELGKRAAGTPQGQRWNHR